MTGKWHASVPCHGKTRVFFPSPGERASETARRVARAKRICLACPHTERCRQLAGPVDDRGVSRWTGIWAGETRLNADDMRRTRRDAKRKAAS